MVIWREVADLPPGAFYAQAEVGLLALQEEALVEQPNAQKGLAAHEHEGARRPIALALVLISGRVELALTRPRRMDRPALGDQRLAERAGQGGKAVDRSATASRPP